MTDIPALLDAALEAPVVPSFTKVGFAARKRLFHWSSLDEYALSGRVIAVTGATSGIGRATAEQLAHDGATLVVIGRDPARNAKLADDLRGRTGNDDIRAVAADLGDLDAVRDAAAQILARYDRLDALVHNAGALTSDRHTNRDGIEATVASQVVGPFLLTSLLLERMVESAPARVITTSSGGMYTAELTVADLQMDTEHYTGTKQYARAKRAQVTLNQLWADRYPDRAVVFHAMHPGWADTPGVEASLPGFRRVMGPLLRTPEQGADTLAWLAADDGTPLATTGEFWLDRHTRQIHRLGSTRRSDTAVRRAELWDWVVGASGATADRA